MTRLAEREFTGRFIRPRSVISKEKDRAAGLGELIAGLWPVILEKIQGEGPDSGMDKTPGFERIRDQAYLDIRGNIR